MSAPMTPTSSTPLRYVEVLMTMMFLSLSSSFARWNDGRATDRVRDTKREWMAYPIHERGWKPLRCDPLVATNERTNDDPSVDENPERTLTHYYHFIFSRAFIGSRH